MKRKNKNFVDECLITPPFFVTYVTGERKGVNSMKKAALVLVIILVFAMPVTAFAETRALSVNPVLNFNGTTATCEATVVGNNTSEYIVVTMKLMHGTTCEASWTETGYGYVYMKEYEDVTKGQTYELVVEVTFNGVKKTPVSVSGTC